MGSVYKNAMKQLSEAAALIQLDKHIVNILEQPKNSVEFIIPVKMDNGEVNLYKGYRVQHNDACLLYTSDAADE